MKKVISVSILTLFIVLAPAFLVKVKYMEKPVTNNKAIETNNFQDSITTFSSNTSFKKTYYINGERVNVYEDNSGRDKVINYLRMDDIVVAYKEERGYIYCEDNNGSKGWIRKNENNLKGMINKDTQYNVDVDLKNQVIKVYEGICKLREFSCSTGKIGDQETETPIGIFKVQEKGESFYSNKYKEGGKYYIKFFADYLIHSVPVDQYGNIIEEESEKIGTPASHGCIRVRLSAAKWMYNNIPKGSAVVIHY